MNVLEKILEEIEEATFQEDAPIYIGNMEVDGYVRASRVKDIIRSHMNEKEKVTSAEIISRKTNGKPYYGIKYKKVGEDHYPGRYPFRYANGMNNTHVQNPHFTDANFTLVIYGPVVNPQVIIGDKSYLVNIVLEQGERLEIDSRTRTVTKISKNGEQVNAFHNREKGKKFFKKIPPGRQKVVWSGKFDWDLVIYEERSEPRWSGWKQR